MEKELIKLAEQRKQKFRVRFIPIVNIKTVEYKICNNLLKNKLSTKNYSRKAKKLLNNFSKRISKISAN
jgi:hypothetical protein